jgi:membrane fusion protein (multidrug efflux system)
MTAEKKKKIGRVFMALGVLAMLAVTGVVYAFSGRFISTDNSYVKANKIMVAPEVSGALVAVKVGDHQQVHKGDVLFEIDPATFKIAVEKAQSDLDVVRTDIEQLKASARQKAEELKSAKADRDLANALYRRRTGPGMQGAVSAESVDQAANKLEVATSKMAELEQELSAIRAKLAGNVDIAAEEHPMYKAAVATLDSAKLNLSHATVHAPVDGTTGEMPREGAYMPAGVPAVGIIEDGTLWIEANFKETELTNIREGQKAEVEIDTYPGRKWEGTVSSIAPATGAEFSVLPAQNATGNWVKVVQRIAVRISPDRKNDDPPLHTGMSAEVTIDTGEYPHMPRGNTAEAAVK